MTRIREEENRLLQSYLSSVGPAGVFARWVVGRKPEGISFGAYEGSRRVGVAILGPSIGLPQASSCWVFSDTAPAFTCLLARLRSFAVGPVSFPLRFDDCARNMGQISVDRFYTLTEIRAQGMRNTHEVERLSRRRLGSLTIPSEMTHLIGRIEDFPDEFPFYGIVTDNTLVAVAESGVRDSHVATIQQVFTMPSARGRGLGRAIVSYVAAMLRSEGLVPTYLVAEANRGSIALAEAVGFELDSRWGFTELSS